MKQALEYTVKEKTVPTFRPNQIGSVLCETGRNPGEIANLHHFFPESVRNAAKLQLLPFRHS